MGQMSENISKVWTAAKQGQWKIFLPAFLVFYSFFKEVKVSDPFLYKYQTEFQNYTAETLNGDIYPYYSYACLIGTIVFFLFTDIFLYKPIMYLEVIGHAFYRFSLLFMDSILSQQIGHAMWGFSTALDVACDSYIYATFEKDQYKKMTSWVRAAVMAGRTAGFTIAQLVILFHIGTYRTNIWISFCIFCLTGVFCFLVPRASWRKIVDKIADKKSKAELQQTCAPLPTSYREYMFYRLKKLKSDFIKIYSNFAILKWCFWWAISVCMVLQVNLYGQTLLGEVQFGDSNPLNGLADAIYTFATTVLILLMSHLPIDWDVWGEAILVMVSVSEGGFLILFSGTNSVYLMYFCYILYRSFCQVVVVIAQWNIAKHMVTDSYGLVLGVNYFTAISIQSILTRIVNDKRGLGMRVREAFLVYSGLHAFISMIFSLSVIYSVVSYCRSRNKVQPTESSSKIITESSDFLSTEKLSESMKINKV